MALGGIEASRHKNNVWVKLSGYWEHNGAKCCQIFSITKAGHCRRVKRGRRKEGKGERERERGKGRAGERKNTRQGRVGGGNGGKSKEGEWEGESAMSGTKQESEEHVTKVKGLRLLLAAKFTTLKGRP